MRIAIDCDLRTSYAVTDTGWHGRGPTPRDAVHGAPLGQYTVLFEIASPVSFNRQEGQQAAMTQLARWALWNVAQAVLTRDWFSHPHEFFVAPSNVWTKGHSEKVRHMIADCKLPKKDLRECEAMLFFHKLHPEDWVPLSDYLRNL